jgi:uracil phosphoribosyltransferase
MFVLTSQNSVANHWLADLRNIQTHQNRADFRQNMMRVGEVLAYEISKTFVYQKREVQTPLATAQVQISDEKVVLATVLRAGLPFYQGFLNVFERAESAFLGAYRGEHQADESFEIQLHYAVSPNLEDKTLILIDPMLATGKSLLIALKKLMKNGTPRHIHIVAIIASKPGIAYLQENIQQDFSLWVGDVDENLNHKSYIVPGLGDAGDLAFGMKV